MCEVVEENSSVGISSLREEAFPDAGRLGCEPSPLSAVRAKAWETRRAKYGPRGHNGYGRRKSAPPVVEIRWLGGNCPVQAEGTINGEEFYFRARGERWTIGIGGDVVMNPTFGYGEAYGSERFAGWMSEEEARQFIDKVAALYAAAKLAPPGASQTPHRHAGMAVKAG